MQTTMSKKQKHLRPIHQHADKPPESPVVERVEEKPVEQPQETPKPRISNAMARPCSSCAALRPEGSNYSRIYSKQGETRYCKCDFCGNTWKQTE